MIFHATESFPFGEVALSCVSSPSLGSALVVQRLSYTPTLPDGMSVDLVAAYRISFAVSFPVHAFSFDFTRSQCETKGSTDRGEYLEAQSWEIGDGVLFFGTEDREALDARMPWLKTSGGDEPIEYLRNGFRFAIPYVKPRTTVGFHFALAYNRVESCSGCECFAVDVPHRELLECSVARHISGAVAGTEGANQP